MSKRILIRADAGHVPEIGTGHVMRATRLADALRVSKACGSREIVFATRTKAPFDLGSYLVEQAGYGIIDHSSLEPNSESEIDCIIRAAPAIVILDRLETSKKLVLALRNADIFVVTFDDRGEGQAYANLAIHPLLHSVESRDNVFVGYKYLFSISDDLIPATIRQRAERVFVSFGGYDHRGLNHYLLQMIPKIVGPLRYDFAVGELKVGDINHLKACAQSISRAANVEVNIHHRPVHYSRLLCESDLAVVSGGLTAFACAQAGIPSIAIPQYEHQLTNISNLAEIGCLKLGSREMRLDPNLIHNLVTELANDSKARLQMNAAGLNAIDGKGLARTTQLIEAKYSGTACTVDN